MSGSTVTPQLRIPDHELLRLVGKGAYGEVWMARNALGSLCAVKVVWRKKFDDDRPYEREFNGIRKFAPVSRKHEGLIDLYHVGRNDEEGYFFYVMELADDAASLASTEGEYRPLTLREEVRARGRTSVAKALEIGTKLASALVHLHGAGLVHRDIKPSNIIVVGGVPKLADIGLVAGISDARSYVGTEGYVPPEGPGTPSADVFGLGKVLYELGTGKDRNEFPKLPAVGGESGIDPREFAEFNEVLLKACDPEAKSRYRTAAELFGDLVLLQGGKSLRRLRGLERQAAILTKVGIAAAIVATLASAAYYGSFKQIQRAVRAERQAVANVELLEMQKAEDLFRRDDSSSALAHLAHVVRANPTNRVAAERLMSALTWRNFVLPYAEPMVPDDRPRLAVFSPDGSEIVSGSFSGTLQFWDSRTGDLSWEFKVGDRGVFSIDWSGDWKRFVVGGDRIGLVYDLPSHRPVVSGIYHGKRIGSVQFSPDERWILTASYDGTARIWDARTGQPTDRVFSHVGRLRRAVFSEDGNLVATAGIDDRSVRIWDSATALPVSPPRRHDDRVNDVAFSPDGCLVASASDDGTARIWRAPDGLLLGRLVHSAQVSDVLFSPDGSRVATTSEDGTASLWDVVTFKMIGSPMRHRAWVKDLKFSPDGSKIVTASEDNTTRLWDATTALPISEPMRHPQAVATVAFSPHGSRLVTAVSWPGGSSLWLWTTTIRSAKSVHFPVAEGLRAAKFRTRTGQLCVASDHWVSIWPHDTVKQAPEVVDVGVPVELFNIAPTGDRAVVVSGTNAWVWDLSIGKVVEGPLSSRSRIWAAEFSPDSKRLLLATAGGFLDLWDLDAEPGSPVSQRLLPQPGMPEPTRDDGVFTARFSQDGRLMVAACRDKKARVFDVATAKLLVELSHEHWVLSAEFSRDSRRVVTASNDRDALVWDVATGRKVGRPMHHDNDVLMAVFSPDGLRVATASRDWTARVWDATTGLPVSEPLRHSGPVKVVCFSPDGSRLATGSLDQTARIWDAETGQPLTDPIPHGGTVDQVEFTRDGSRLLMVPSAGDIQLAEVLQAQVPAPEWLPALAEAVARQRLNERQMTEPVAAEQLFRLKRELNDLPLTSANARWAKWFMADPDRRKISPDSEVSLSSHIVALIRSGTCAALREAVWLEPANATAHAHLARELVARFDGKDRKELSDADWHQKYARRLAPSVDEITRICDGVAARLMAIRGGVAGGQ